MLLALFLGYLLFWTVANWPALTTAWWSSDDYAILTRFDPLHNLQLGRPLEALHHWGLTWEAQPTWLWLNCLWRYGQGILHTLTAFLAGYVLYRATMRRQVWLYLLFFLLWPFHGEAVLWRASAIVPGAALSMAGLVLLTRSYTRRAQLGQVSGLLLVATAVLAHQLAAVIALVVWMLATTFGKPDYWTRPWQHFARLLLGYLIGGAISLALIHHFAVDLGRATPTTAWLAKALLAAKLNGLLLIAPVYPLELRIGQSLFLAMAIGLWVYCLATQRCWGLWRPMFSLLSLLLLPYAPLLLVDETLLAPRNLYLGPFLLVGAALMIDQLQKQRRATILVGAISLLLVVSYLPLNWRNVREFPQLYQQDRQILTTIEERVTTASEDADMRLVVATAPAYLRTWNPYTLPLMWGDAKKSAFLVEWAAPAFIEWHSSLTVVEEPNTRQWCVEQCQLQQDRPPFSLVQLDYGLWCLCP
jgi:hypothetical protein